jgi:hypothetical protein
MGGRPGGRGQDILRRAALVAGPYRPAHRREPGDFAGRPQQPAFLRQRRRVRRHACVQVRREPTVNRDEPGVGGVTYE